METAHQSLLLVHGLCGLVVLITFWIAAFAKKGSSLHLRGGKRFMPKARAGAMAAGRA